MEEQVNTKKRPLDFTPLKKGSSFNYSKIIKFDESDESEEKKRCNFRELENDLREIYRLIGTGRLRGCYIVSGFYRINGVRIPFVKIGYTTSLFSFQCPIKKKMIYGRIYTIIKDLRSIKGVTYAKVDKIHAFFCEKERSLAPIESFEEVLLKKTKEFKLQVGSSFFGFAFGKREYRKFEHLEKILKIALELQEECQEYVTAVHMEMEMKKVEPIAILV